jgi:spermidine synthase
MASSTAAPTTARRDRWALGLLMFLLGGCGLAYEYTLSKIASDLLGNSVPEFSLES